MSVSTGRVVPKTCKSWLCASCNVWLRQGARKLIRQGAASRPAGWETALLTFTEPTRATLDLPALHKRHKNTVAALRRRSWIGEYVTAVEFQERGALHPHLVAHVPPDLAPRLRPFGADRRDRSQYRWHFHELVPLARELGWGPVCDAVLADSPTDLDGYATKRLAGYATKAAYRRFKDAGAKRVRPIRASRAWVPERLRDLQHGDSCDPGPWQDVSQIGPCR